MRCRRGHIAVISAIILSLVVIELLRGVIYTSGGSSRLPGEEEWHINASDFLAKNQRLTLEPSPALTACHSSKVEVLVVVTSAVGHNDARTAVRSSWLPRFPSSWILVFFLGATEDHSQQDVVNEEARKFEDIIQDSRFADTYYNLTLKSLAVLHWTQKFCPNAKFLLKIDDDMYLNIPKLHHLTTCTSEAMENMYHKNISPDKYIENNHNESSLCSQFRPYELIHYYINADDQEYESYFFGGYLYKGVLTDRNKRSKWYLAANLYSSPTLPPFLSGTAYILSTNLVQHLLHASKHEPLIHLEDVYLSGLVGSLQLKLKLSHVDGWSRFRPLWNSVCLFKELITVHGLSPLELKTMTASVHSIEPQDCDRISVQFSNYVNSLLSSIFPRIT